MWLDLRKGNAMLVGFSTLGCPNWTLEEIRTKAVDYGYDGIDFRGLLDTLDVTQLPEFTSDIAETARLFADAGLAVSGISSSIGLCDAEKRQENIDEAKRTIAVAKGLGCKNVRVFGRGRPREVGRDAAADIGSDCMHAILELDGARDLRWLLETHDEWIRSDHVKLLLERVPDTTFGVLWDVGHTPRTVDETPGQTIAALGSRIGYTHIKDAVFDPDHELAMSDGWRYVMPGTGQVPIAHAVSLLIEHGYDIWVVLEHEKRWHRELPEPEDIFPAFAQWAKNVIGGEES
jgi:sugar phosphate isomerase/epimerase